MVNPVNYLNHFVDASDLAKKDKTTLLIVGFCALLILSFSTIAHFVYFKGKRINDSSPNIKTSLNRVDALFNQVVFNDDCLKRELRKKGKYVSPLNLEGFCLKQLGFQKNQNYGDKEFLFLEFTKRAKDEISKKNPKSQQEAIQLFLNLALKVRLEQVGLVDENKIEKFKIIREFYDDLMSQMLKEQFPIKLPSYVFPKWGEKLIKNFRKGVQQLYFLSSLTAYQSFFQELFKADKDLNLEELETFKKDHMNMIKREWNQQETFENSAKEKLSFMKDFGPYLAYEMIQGFEDSNETLVGGICHALVLELLTHSLENPEDYGERLKPTINAHTRFVQAKYHAEPKVQPKATYLFTIGNTKGLEQDLSEYFSDNKGWMLAVLKFSDQLKTKLQAWQSNDEFLIHLDSVNMAEVDEIGHSIAIRVQAEIYEFFDPNVGHFVFKGKDGKDKLCNCLTRLFRFQYPKLAFIYFEQLI